MENETIDNLCIGILETAKKYNLKTVTLRLSWWEPTLVMNKWLQKLNTLKEQLQRNQTNLRVIFLTNGTTINDDKIQQIKKYDLWVWISMDGLWDYHDKFRTFSTGKWSFEIVYKNIQKLLTNNINPSINCVVSNENIDWLPKLTQFFIDNNLFFRYSFVQGEELNQEKLIYILNECYNIIEKAIEKWYKFSNKHRLCDLKFLNPSDHVCWWGYAWWAIYIDGWMYFCQIQFGQEKEMGNINKNHDLIDLIEKWSYFNTWLPNDCNWCNYKYICSWWCPIERWENKDPHCNVYKAMIPKIYKLLWKEKLLQILRMQNV